MMVEDLTLIKCIGKGSFGEVFLTSKAGMKAEFATKKVAKSLVLKGNVKRYFNNEIYILKNISHPNIIKLHEIKQTLNNYYLVFDLCNGGGLSNCLEKYKKEHNKPFPENVVQCIMRQIVLGLEYLHNKKILHRDLKLDNLLVHFENEEDKNSLNMMKAQVKIIDFGFARFLESEQLAQSVLGSPINMDPQILNKMRKIDNNQSFGYDQKADIWSLGTICYELLIGVPPFDATSYDELVKKVSDGNYKIPNNLHLSTESISFINAMLQFDPKNRLDVNELARHQFIVNDCKGFHTLTVKKNLLNQSSLTLNTKESKGIWQMFQNEEKSLEEVPSLMIDETREKSKESSRLGPQEDYIPDQVEKMDINREKLESNRSENTESSKPIQINEELKNFLIECFDSLNSEFFSVEPMLIPIVPSSDPKVFELDI